MTSAKSYATEQRLDALVDQAGPVAANVSVPDIKTAGDQELTHRTIPGGTVRGTERYEGMALGVCSTGGTAPTAMKWTVYADGAGSGILAQLAVPAAGLIPGLANAGWQTQFDVFWVSPSEAECGLRVWWRTGTGISGSAAWHTVQNNTGIDTTADKSLTLAFGFTGTGVTLVTKAAHIARTA